jgi:hypothetical protein
LAIIGLLVRCIRRNSGKVSLIVNRLGLAILSGYVRKIIRPRSPGSQKTRTLSTSLG